MQDTVAAENTIDVRGCKLHLRRAGRGEPLLFLHGAQGLNGREPGLEALAKSFDVIAPDHPGFGRSDNSELIDDASDLALFYLDLLDTLKLDRVHVVGQCIGGWVALEMAIRTTERLEIAGAGFERGHPREGRAARRHVRLLGGRAAQAPVRRHGCGGMAASWRATPDLEDIYDRNRAAAAKYSWSPRLCNPKLERWLHRIDVPTHIIWGQDDQVIPPAYAAALKESIAGATATTLPDCAHLPHIEQPQAFADEVSQFIRRAAR